MRKYTAPPNGEILGQNIRAWVDNLQGPQTAPIMQKYGLTNVDPQGWYSLKSLMDAMDEIVHSPNASSNLVAIGMAIGKIVPLPPTITLGEVLLGWNAIYQSLHRNADVGEIRCEKIKDTHYRITFTDLYPDDFSYGIMYGYAQRLLPRGTNFKVAYDTEITRRDQGGQGATVIHLQWS